MDSGHQVQERAAWAGSEPGAEVRRARRAGGLTLAQLGARTGYSAAQVSRFERGLAPLNDIAVLWLFADALAIPPEVFGLTPRPPGHRQPPRRIAPSSGPALSLAPTVACEAERESGEDAVRRRQLLANLTVTAAAAASTPLLGSGTAQVPERSSGLLLTERVRDTMLGLSPVAATIPAGQLRSGLASAMTDFHACRYARLARALPSLIASGHAAAAQAPDDPAVNAALAQIYTLVTRMLIKLDDPQLGWMAADRARVIAGAAADPLITAEAARNLAVLARKAGWHDQATSIALSAADDPGLRGADRHRLAERGLLIQSAAYTAARHGDRSRARELTDEAAAIAARLRGATLLRDHGGGFSPATVELHRISAEHYVGEPGAALAAARRISPASLPSIERRARYYTDVARASGQAGRRDDCLNALLAAEREAPEEIHARPAIRDLITGLLLSGRTTRELRGLAARCRVV